MSTPAPPAPTPPPQPDAPLRVEALVPPVRLVLAIVLGVLSLGGTAAAAYYGATGKLERVAERAEQVAAAVTQLRSDTERQQREYQQATNARLEAMARERQEDREAMVRVQEQLRALSGAVGDMRGDVRVLLDRVNASPRPRTARDYP